MDDLQNRWITLPKVDVEYQHLLTVNNKMIDISDTSVDMLSDYLEIGRPTIDQQLDLLQAVRLNSGDLTIRPFILVGKLAVAASEEFVFTKSGLDSLDLGQVNATDLQRPYQPYWFTIEKASYRPEVYPRIISSFASMSGTWLGLRRP